MTQQQLLQDLQGEESQALFADRLGIGQGHISMLLNGERKAGRQVVAALMREFPHRKEEILQVFLRSKDDDCDDTMTEIPK